MIIGERMMETKLLIFDLDGTLANTLYTITDAVNMCLDHFCYPQQSLEQVCQNIGNGARVLLEKSLPSEVAKDSERFATAMEYFNECYLKTHDNIDGCYDGVYELVCDLHAQGYKLAVLSNKPDRLVKSIIKKLFSEGMFICVEGQTDLPRKPDPTVPLMMAKRCGASADNCFFIGDSEVDVKTAKNAGMHAIAVSWGFRDRALLEGAEFIADNADELRVYFDKK